MRIYNNRGYIRCYYDTHFGIIFYRNIILEKRLLDSNISSRELENNKQNYQYEIDRIVDILNKLGNFTIDKIILDDGDDDYNYDNHDIDLNLFDFDIDFCDGEMDISFKYENSNCISLCDDTIYYEGIKCLRSNGESYDKLISSIKNIISSSVKNKICPNEDLDLEEEFKYIYFMMTKFEEVAKSKIEGFLNQFELEK